MHSTIAKERHLILQHKTPSDDCRCETCENATLLLSAVKLNLTKLEKAELAAALLEDPIELMNSSVCTVKDFKCISGQCAQCPGSSLTHDIGKAISNTQAISYYRRETTDKHMKKVQKVGSGEYVVELLNEIIFGEKFCRHCYNIYRQYSELKFMKKNLKENEVILSVDFSRNYENKQVHEVQSAYFGHENFTLYTAACYFHKSLGIDGKSDPNDLTVISMAIISNETSHDRNVAFTNNNKLIRIVREMAPTIDTFHFWSDGCAGQFRSRYVFRSFCAYPADIKLTWDYGEAHHFKGMFI